MNSQTTVRIPGVTNEMPISDYTHMIVHLRAITKAMLEKVGVKTTVEVIGEFDGIALICSEEKNAHDLVDLYVRCAASRTERLKRAEITAPPATSR